MKVSETILKQLGGNRFVVMTGAKNFSTSGTNLSFKVGKNAGKVPHINIKLDDNDTYTVTFSNIRGTSIKTIKECDGVYCDMLRDVFEETTGMATSL